MATVKGTTDITLSNSSNVEVRYVIHLTCDEMSPHIPQLMQSVRPRVMDFVKGREYTFEDLSFHRELIERYWLTSDWGKPFIVTRDFASKIDLLFEKMPERPIVSVVPAQSAVEIREVVKYIERPEPPKKTAAEKVKERIEEKVAICVSASKATEELLARYADEMERDPDLREALTRLLESEKLNVFDS